MTATRSSGDGLVRPAIAPALGWLLLIGGVAVAFGWVVFAQKLGDTITLANVGAAMSVYYALLFLPLIALALGLGMIEGRRSARAGARAGRWLGIGAALGLAGLLTTLAYTALNGGVARGQGGYLGAWLLALGLALTLVQVFAEEVLFRGWLQPALVARIGPVAGVGCGAVLFAALHLTSGARAPFSLVNLVLGGVWFGMLALRSGGLVAPLAAHFTWNATEDMGFGLTPNPGAGAFGSVFDWDLVGRPLWGGQEEGLNASLGTTFVLVALIVPLLFARRPAPAHTGLTEVN